jgi:hypothetical protein
VKLGVLHPVSGALSYSGQQGRIGAHMAIEEINAAGGIKALAAPRSTQYWATRKSTPEGGSAEVEKMNSADVAAVVGGYASNICLAASQTARALRPALYVGRRRGRRNRHREVQEHVPFRSRLRRHCQDRADQSRHHQRSGRQARQDRDDRARRLVVRLAASPNC